jgi:hypothetical protein
MDPIPSSAHPVPRGSKTANDLSGLAIGLGAFMAIDLLVLNLFRSFASIVAGVVFAAVMAGLAVFLYRLGERWLALGIGLGFAVMTVVTGGVCTLFSSNSSRTYGAVAYFYLATGALVAAGIARGVVAFKRRAKAES